MVHVAEVTSGLTLSTNLFGMGLCGRRLTLSGVKLVCVVCNCPQCGPVGAERGHCEDVWY